MNFTVKLTKNSKEFYHMFNKLEYIGAIPERNEVDIQDVVLGLK